MEATENGGVSRSRRVRRTHDSQLKALAVQAVLRDGRTVLDVSKEIDVSRSLLDRWITKARQHSAAGLAPPKTEGGADTPAAQVVQSKKVDLFKPKGRRKWSARLILPDGKVTEIETGYTQVSAARMKAAQKWMMLAREAGLLPARKGPGRPRKERAPIDKTYGRDKEKGHALAALATIPRGGGRRMPNDNIRNANRARALVEVLAIVQEIDVGDALFVLRAAGAVVGLNERMELVSNGMMTNGHARAEVWPT